MTGEATEGPRRSLRAGDTHTLEFVKSLRWRGGKKSGRMDGRRKAETEEQIDR